MKIALIGYGRMGKTIEKIAVRRGHEIVLKIGRENAEDLTTERIKSADVAIDFSLPHTAFHNISVCLEGGVPIVSGTTGWLDRYEEIVEKCKERNGAFFYASNFSVGVNIFRVINRRLAELMNDRPEYEVSLEEIHHIHKLDAPSGTAKTLAEEIADRLARKSGYESEGDAVDKIRITSKREGEVPGTHTITYTSEIDTLQIRHQAHGRQGFALGAVLAAEWLPTKKGVFGMEDLLGL